jgi:hypothetical protein
MNFTAIKNRELVNLFLIAITLAILLGFFVFPVFNKIKAIESKINEEQSLLNSRMKLGANSKQIADDLEQAEISLLKLDSIYIKEGSELELINFIETIAQRNDLELKIKPDFNIPKIGTDPIKIAIDISAKGTFNNISNFLKALDSAPFYLITDRLNLQKNQSDLTLTINGHVYLKK